MTEAFKRRRGDETDSLLKQELFARYAATTGKLRNSTGVAFG